MRVAVIGLGEMGGAIAANLVAKGYEVGVFDLDDQRREALGEQGCAPAGSAEAAAAGAQVVHVVVFTDAQARSLVLGEPARSGLLSTLDAGSVLVVHSTISPSTCTEFARVAKERGVDVLDAGMTGAGAAARAGTMTLLVGGETAIVDACRDELGCIASAVLHVGPLGTGMVAKIVNNISVLANAEVARQLIGLGTAAGLPESTVLKILNEGTGRSWVSEHWDLVRGTVEHPDDGTTFAAMARKDCRARPRTRAPQRRGDAHRRLDC